MKNQKKKKSLKRFKEEIDFFINDDLPDKALSVCDEIIKLYPNNSYGYELIIKIRTNSYTKYLQEDQLKDLKIVNDKLCEVASKKDKNKFKLDFEDYVLDCKEFQNYYKLKNELIEKLLLKKTYEEGIFDTTKKINQVSSYHNSDTKIKSFYNLLTGIFFVCCLIFNLIYYNYLLFITIPFGLFGLISVQGVISSWFFKKNSKNTNRIKPLINKENDIIEEYKSKIKTLNETILFLNEQKQNCILKIPKTFVEDNTFIDDEEKICNELFSLLSSNRIDDFNKKFDNYKNVNSSDFIQKTYLEVLNKNDDVKTIIDNIVKERKDNNQAILLMKKVNIIDFVFVFLLSFISLMIMINIKNNFCNINIISFVIAIVVGIVSVLAYNTTTGKHDSLIDMFADNLATSVFKASLTYDLIFWPLEHDLKFTYAFIKIPVMFALLYLGFAIVVSLLKYQHLYKKMAK